MRQPKVTDLVLYYVSGQVNQKPSVGLVTAVSLGGIVSLHVFDNSGRRLFRDCVRHVSDPFLAANPEARRAEGAYQFEDELKQPTADPGKKPEAKAPEAKKPAAAAV